MCLVNSEKAAGSGYSGGEEEGKGKWRRGEHEKGNRGESYTEVRVGSR